MFFIGDAIHGCSILVYHAMSGNHSTVNVKNYQFLYPSVALWQDFNDLDLLDSKKKKKSGKSKPKGKKSSYFSKGRSEGTERPKNMKR